MSDQPPTHNDILTALHSHDVRLVRLESEVSAVQRDVIAQAGRMDKAAEKLEQLAEAVAGLEGTQKLIFWIVATGIPIIAGLELWDRLSR